MRSLLFAFLAAISILTLPGCFSNPATGRSQFIVISDGQARALGDEAAPDLIQQYGGAVATTELQGYVSEVGRAITEHIEEGYEEIEWTFVVLDSDIINAFALPNGTVSITRGLISRFESEAQLAGVLGHEIGHVTALHVSEQISRDVVTQGLLTGVGVATDSAWAVQAAQMFSQGYGLKFNRGQESEADALGVKYMTRAGYDPRGMLQVLEVLAEAAGDERQPEILATHPHPETRIAAVNILLSGPYAYTRDNPNYKMYKGRFQQLAGPYLASLPAKAIFGSGCWSGECTCGHGSVQAAAETTTPGT